MRNPATYLLICFLILHTAFQDEVFAQSNCVDRIGEYERNIQSDPDDLNALLQLARCYSGTGSCNAVPSLLNGYIERHPTDSLLRFERARCYKELGMFDEAISDLNEILSFHPRSRASLYQRSLCYYSIGDYAAARNDLRVLNSNDPTLALQLFYARSCLADSAILDGLEMLDNIVAKDPDNLQALLLRARFLIANEEYNEALIDLNKIQELGFCTEDCIFWRAFSLKRLGRISDAYTLIRDGLSHAGISFDANLLLAECASDLGSDEEALKYIQVIEYSESITASQLKAISGLYWRMGKYPLAISTLERAMDMPGAKEKWLKDLLKMKALNILDKWGITVLLVFGLLGVLVFWFFSRRS